MANKPRVLLYWGYHRNAWTAPFVALSDQFEFIYLFHLSQTTEIVARSDLKVLYFGDFSSIQQIYKKVNPDKIVFIGLDGIMSILMNKIAADFKIPTFLIQHGFLYSYEDKIREQYQELKRHKTELDSKEPQSDKKYTRKFLINSLRPNNIDLFLKLLISRKLARGKVELEWLRDLRDKRRLAGHYLLYAPYFADLYIKRDGVQDRISYFGNPEVFQHLQRSKHTPTKETKEKYLLHIDQPLFHAYQKGSKPKFTLNEAENFYKELATYAEKEGLKLLVKLHPYSYSHIASYSDHPNIRYITSHEAMNELLNQAEKITGFYSTLLLSAFLLKPTLLFQITDNLNFVQDLENQNITRVLPLNANHELMKREFEREFEISQEFISKFYYSLDTDPISILAKKLMQSEKQQT